MVGNIQMKRMWKCKKPMPCGVRPSELADCSEPCEKYKKWRRDEIEHWIVCGIVALAAVGICVYLNFLLCNN
jgi:hypothetical protein